MFSIYVGKAGGIAPAHEIAEFAHSVGIRCTIGSNLELGVGSEAMIHLALSARGVDADTYPCDIIGPMFYVDDLLAEGPQISGGSAGPGDRPGLGVVLDDEKSKSIVCGRVDWDAIRGPLRPFDPQLRRTFPT